MKRFVVLFVLVLGLSACKPAEIPQGTPIAAPGINVTVSREDCTSMEVQAGTQVVWTNEDTVTLPVRLEKVDDSENTTLVSQSEIGPGDSFATQLLDTGTYRLYCTAEKDKYGTITVK